MEKKLQVRNLRISFRTSGGKVQAVRGIDFDLYKGKTLAIVGESGSGKSVTSKAILGILPGNAMIEGGEIIYDGRNLLKISEDELHHIRGDKIAMIFQDPMSSLNPIVRIGRQLTEAMILKGRARQRESRITFNTYIKCLSGNMIAAVPEPRKARAAELTRKCKAFDSFEYRHIKLEEAYNRQREAANEAVIEIDMLSFELEKNAAKDIPYRVGHISKMARETVGPYMVHDREQELKTFQSKLKSNMRLLRSKDDSAPLRESLQQIKTIMEQALAMTPPNFFALGYYETFVKKPLPDLEIDELNGFLRKELDNGFMLDFIREAKIGLMHSARHAYEEKEKAIDALMKQRAVFEQTPLDKAACNAAQQALERAVRASIDTMELQKDSVAYIFPSALKSEIERYFDAIRKNELEEKRFAKQSAKHDEIVKRGKTPEWEVVPKSIADLEQIRADILRLIDEQIAHNRMLLQNRDKRDFDTETVALIDFFKANASGVVNKVTKRMAKEKAIRLMEEVGIPEPRKRYTQYPFEFSGGMRQRIVIAIALAANPDILICDEPTTALDVTIQAQILELINKLKQERKLTIIFITHDLGVVANMADLIAVMYAGKIAEYGTAEDIFYHAAHPYTWALLSSMPDLDTNEKLDAIPGTPPNLIYPPAGDAFAERNQYAMQIDFEAQPPLFKISETHYAATWLLHPDAPKVTPPKTLTDRIDRMNRKRGMNHGE